MKLNKYVGYIVVSVVAILIPLIGLLYGFWDANQPKTGPVGDGTQIAFTPVQLLVNIGVMLTGALNLIVAIKTYLEHKKTNENENKGLDD
jgi:ABC-type Na+ efflux pump permease subunit